MSQAIRIALIVVAVGVIIALLAPILSQLTAALLEFASGFPALVGTLAPYLNFGRQMLNALVGVPVLVDIMLWFTILSPLALHTVGFVSKIFRKVVG